MAFNTHNKRLYEYIYFVVNKCKIKFRLKRKLLEMHSYWWGYNNGLLFRKHLKNSLRFINCILFVSFITKIVW